MREQIMQGDIVVRVDHVSKKYCKSLKRSMIYGLHDIGRNVLGLSSHSETLRPDEFWAVKDVSFEVKKGETLGIIGPNGSGKTTVLKMLNGIFWPDKGKISVYGKTGALIAVGAGFHPALTGRENIYVDGAILGLTKRQIEEKIDGIIEFADIKGFIDSPVKYYSSGMFVKLGFSIAVNIEPEVLLIDEILSVGDLSFQNKSLQKLAELREKANAIIFVSHNLEHIRNLCDRVLILDEGKQIFLGDTTDAVSKYHSLTREKRLAKMEKRDGFEFYGHLSTGVITFRDSGILDESGARVNRINFGDDINLFFDFKLNEDKEELFFSIGVLEDKNVVCIWQVSNDKPLYFRNLSVGSYRLAVKFISPQLAPGVYTPVFATRDKATNEVYERINQGLGSFIIGGDATPRGIIQVNSSWTIKKTG